MQSIFSALVCYILTKEQFNRGGNNEKITRWDHGNEDRNRF